MSMARQRHGALFSTGSKELAASRTNAKALIAHITKIPDATEASGMKLGAGEEHQFQGFTGFREISEYIFNTLFFNDYYTKHRLVTFHTIPGQRKLKKGAKKGAN